MPYIVKTMNEIVRCGMQYRNEKLAPFGLKSSHASYLLEICRSPGISQDTLAKRICFNKSTIARQIAVLEDGGFVRRKPGAEDKRVMELYPTEKTLELMPQIRQVLRSWRSYLMEGLSEEEIAVLDKALTSMRSRAGDWMEEL